MQTLLVKKFGGTSVGTLERISAVADQLIAAHRQGAQLVVVVSAMSGETDRLLNLADQLSPSPNHRELAALVTTGEQVSMSLLAIALEARGCRAKSYNASQLAIITDQAHMKARIIAINTQKILADVRNQHIVIVAGFQGLSQTGDVTTLGRGGSDTSAVALACALHAHECQIYTDVDGIYTADPRVVPSAYRLDRVDFRAMLVLATLGSKVLQWRSVALAGKYRIPLRVLSSFKEGYGTLIDYTSDAEALESPQFVGLSHQSGLKRWLITTDQANGDELAMIVAGLAEHNMICEHISQVRVAEQLTITVVFNREEHQRAVILLTPWIEQYQWTCSVESDLARVALVGISLSAHPLVSAKFLSVFRALAVRIDGFLCTEFSLSVLVQEQALMVVLPVLHDAFF